MPNYTEPWQMMKLFRALLCGLVLVVLVAQANAAEKPPVELCNVGGYIQANIGKDGPLKGCNVGDTAHFQIDISRVAYASIVARYCDLAASVVVERHPDPTSSIVHVVCRYQWKWAKEVTKEKHPDFK